MAANIITDAKYQPHPSQEGVFVKHLFGSADNDRLSNLEVCIIPGYQIAPHTHPDASEFFYVARGTGEFLDADQWHQIAAGSAFKAPAGTLHSISNTGSEPLIIFSTFSPPAR